MSRRPLALLATAATTAGILLIPALPAAAATVPDVLNVTVQSAGATKLAGVPVSFVTATGGVLAKATSNSAGVATLHITPSASNFKSGWVEVGAETDGDDYSPKIFTAAKHHWVVAYVGGAQFDDTTPISASPYREATAATPITAEYFNASPNHSITVALDAPGVVHVANSALAGTDWVLENHGGEPVDEGTATKAGALTLSDIVPGAYTLHYRPAKAGLLDGTDDVVVAPGAMTTPTITPTTGATLSGTVTVGGADRKGVPIVVLSSAGLTGGFATATTNSDGAFQVAGLQAGSYVVAYGDDARLADELVDAVLGDGGASSPTVSTEISKLTAKLNRVMKTRPSAVTPVSYIGALQDVTIANVTDPATTSIDLTPAAIVQGRLALKKGRTATVSAEDADGNLLDSNTVKSTGSSVAYALGSIPAGAVKVVVRIGKQWGSTLVQAVQGRRVTAGKLTATHDLLTMHGTTANSPGEAVLNSNGTVGVHEATIDSAGRFVFTGLIPGRFRVGILTKAYDYASHHVTLTKSATKPVAAGAKYGAITGTLLSPLGLGQASAIPLGYADVEFSGGSGILGLVLAETGKNGAFSTLAPAGDYDWSLIDTDEFGAGPMYLRPATDPNGTVSVTSGATTKLGAVQLQALFQ